jgi:RNA polymerase sigma factor (sigma-70 family)
MTIPALEVVFAFERLNVPIGLDIESWNRRLLFSRTGCKLYMSSETTVLIEEFVPTRYTLLSRLRNWDDNESWKDFFDTYWRLIYSVARKSGLTAVESQEVVQETIISVAKHIHKFRRDRELGSFKGWLRNLTRWRIADQLRKRTRLALQPELSDADELTLPDFLPDLPEQNSEFRWEEEWRANLLQAAIDRVKQRVPEEQYQIFDLQVLRQWPVSRITSTLGVSAARVYLAKFRVAALIKKEARNLKKQWEEI